MNNFNTNIEKDKSDLFYDFKNETLCINLNKVDSIKSSNFEKFTINSEKIDLLISRVTG